MTVVVGCAGNCKAGTEIDPQMIQKIALWVRSFVNLKFTDQNQDLPVIPIIFEPSIDAVKGK